MIPVWPADLPQRLEQQAYTQGFADGRLRTAMEAGPPKSRRRSSAAIRPVSGSFTGLSDDMALLERFWTEDTAGGSLPFLLPDQTRDGLLLADQDGNVLADDAGDPLLNTAWWLVLFGESPPSFVPLSGLWYRATVPFTVMPS